MRRFASVAAVLAVAATAYAWPGGRGLPWQRNGRSRLDGGINICGPSTAGYALDVLPNDCRTTALHYSEGSGASITAALPVGQTITVTRSGTRSCILSDGGLVYVSSNQPCVAGSPLQLYAGGVTQNLATHSETLDDVAWTKSNVTVTANQAKAPDQTTTMDRLVSTSGGYIQSNASTGWSANKGAVSIWIASTDGGTQDSILQLYDLDAGSADCTKVVTARPQAQRVWCISAAVFNNQNTLRFYPSADGGAGDVYAWGASLNTYPNNIMLRQLPRYVPTTTAAVISNADVINTLNPYDGGNGDPLCIAATVSPEAEFGSGSAQYVMGIGTTFTGASNVALWNNANVVNYERYAAAGTHGTGGMSAYDGGSARWCGCFADGGYSMYLNGVPQLNNTLDAGYPTLSPTVLLGSTGTNFYANVGVYDFRLGTTAQGTCGLPAITSTVVDMGDSITQGLGSGGVWGAYPYWTNMAKGASWTFTNGGLTGDVVTQIYARWESTYRAQKPTYATWMGGVNDLQVNGSSAAVIWPTIQTFADEALADGDKVVLFLVAPWKGSTNWDSTKQAQTVLLNASIQAYCDAHPSTVRCVDSVTLLGTPGDTATLLSAYDFGDHVHPNVAGEQALAAGLSAVLPF